MDDTANLKIEVISGSICPWCYIGKRRLEGALRLLGNPAARVEWKPFQLNPGMPTEGMDRREYRTRKFGSWSYSQQLDAQVRTAAEQVGLSFAYDKWIGRQIRCKGQFECLLTRFERDLERF